MSYHNRWADRQGTRLHYLDSEPDSDPSLTPLVCIPGALGSAEDFGDEIDTLAPRRVIAVSLRGRGRSDAPPGGYLFSDHVLDVEAVIRAAGVDHFCLLGYSMGAAFALGYAILRPSTVAGLIVAEHPARTRVLDEAWKQRALTTPAGRARPHVIEALQRDSAEIALWDDLGVIQAPVLLIRGDQPDSMLRPEHVEEYLRRLKQAMAVVFPGSGHRLWEPDRDRYLRTLRLFLEGVDASQSPV